MNRHWACREHGGTIRDQICCDLGKEVIPSTLFDQVLLGASIATIIGGFVWAFTL